MKKKIGILTTGGDCSGLNSTIHRLISSGLDRGHKMFGILDGTDGLAGSAPDAIEFNRESLPAAYARLSGSILRNGRPGALNYQTAAKSSRADEFQNNVKKSIERLDLDAIILIGGNGSISLAWANPSVYSSAQLICIPKTIDMDIPLTDKSIGFDTAVNELVKYADQLLLTARSHHRWFIVQTMGRDSGFLCLHAGLASGASAILIPEVKWKMPDLIEHIKSRPTDYGLIFVAEGCKLRGRSGEIAEIIARDFKAAGIPARAVFPEHLQRSGDTTATDRILAARFASAALDAVDNNETFVMTALQNNTVKTISMKEVLDSGVILADPNIPNMTVSNEYVSPNDPLIKTATDLGIFIQ
ncbi:MAG: 6-phosphofructokinase [Rickettsiales bacterium]|jgi:6-phosphofructokinase 1|nr:6-phosphofructokinase [Rickettsiales bacterium]